VQTLSDDEIIEFSAGACISISVNVLREFENIVGIYFLFFAAGREFHIYEESHAPGRGNVICRTTASVASASLLESNVCMYIRDKISFQWSSFP
jgi:hypothetical protein